MAGEHDGMLRVRLCAAPVDGAANKELIAVLADALEVPSRAVEIVSGITSKTKQIRVSGASCERLQSLVE